MEKTVKTICPYCGVGCGLKVKVRGDSIVEVKGDRDHPSTRGGICNKGAQVDQIISTPNRLASALWRRDRSEPLSPTGLNTALDRVAEKFKEVIRRHGPNAAAFYVSGQLTTESQYVFNKLAKGAIGTNNIDANSRLCMASAASAYKMAFGADAPPTCYDDIELAECFFVLGANMAECHPVLWQRVKKRSSNKRTRIIVVDPRRTPTAEAAHLHLPIRPGTDVALLNAILHVLISQHWTNERFIRSHTDDWDALREVAEAWSPARAAKICGIAELDIHRAAFWFGQSAEALSFWTMGANQSSSGVAKNLGVINLHLATGKVGRPGSGPFSLTGQPNAMGGREVGYMSGLLPGHREVTNPDHRRQIARIWGVSEKKIQPESGLDAVSMFEAAEAGDVKALWIVGCNPLATMPNANRIRRALEHVELLIVQDCYHPTETSQFADVVLPAAMNLEMDGTMTNSERRVSLMQRCVSPPGDARPDWEIACRVAALLGFEEQFSYTSAADIFEEHKLCCSDVYQLQLNGISYRRLKRHPVHWPCPDYSSHGIARRYRRKIFATPNGRARFHAVEYSAPKDALTVDYPMALITGRLANHWHSRTKTGHVARLNKINPTPFASAHPEDVQRLGLADGDAVRLVSARGAARTILKVDDSVRPGTLFMSFHWGQSFREDSCVNAVTTSEADPISRQPELKFSAVRLEKDSSA
jgi:anaerobic selenocysteine-containing dehydrogenase